MGRNRNVDEDVHDNDDEEKHDRNRIALLPAYSKRLPPGNKRRSKWVVTIGHEP